MSLFASCVKSSEAVGEISIEEMVQTIAESGSALTIQARVFLEQGNDAGFKNIKLNELSAVTVSGVFSDGRKKELVKAYTGYIILDIDKIEGDADLLKAKVASIPYTYVCFKSISGKGLKIIVQTDALLTEHEQVFEQVSRMYEDVLRVPVDKSGKDVSRLCVLNHDAEIYFNENACVYQAISITNKIIIGNNMEVDYNVLFKKAEFLTGKNYKFIEGNRNNFVFLLANNCNRLAIPKVIAEELIQGKYNLDAKEISNCIEGAYGHIAEYGSLLIIEGAKKQKATKVRSFNQCIEDASNLPHLTQLMGEFIYKGEVTFLVGDTGVGKSILAVNIAIALAKGDRVFTDFVNDGGSLNTLYYDLELGDRQFQNRFPEAVYPDNLHRGIYNPDCIGCDLDLSQIEKDIQEVAAQVVIIDNLSALTLSSGVDAEIAIKFMNELIKIKKKYGITILVLAHTPKLPVNVPLRSDHMAGSKSLANFADNIFFIQKSSLGQDIRYIKLVKCRNGENKNPVHTIQIAKPERQVIVKYIGVSKELDHFFELDNNKAAQKEEARAMRAERKTYEEIGEYFGVNKSTVLRWLK